MSYQSVAGIDAGGTLIKIAYFISGEDEMKFAKFPASRMQLAIDWLDERLPAADICLTGGKAASFQAGLKRNARSIVEFEATCSGVRHFMNGRPDMPQRFILTNVGTGTSIHFVDRKEQKRIGGIGVGGGTLMGLAGLLAGIADFREITQLAKQGKRERIDMKVSDIYEGAEPPIPGDLTASNFAKALHVGQYDQADLLASVIGLIGETVTTVSVFGALQNDISSIVYIGSSFFENDLLRQVVADYTKLRGADPIMLDGGEFSGAVGAMLSLNKT